MPEVDVPARELPDALEAVRVGAPVFARERDIPPIDRHALFSRQVAIAFVDLAEQPRLDQDATRAHHAGRAGTCPRVVDVAGK
jgi:hypothetical protein